MKRRNARNLNLLISLTSLAILLLAGAGYYYIYIQNREDYLHQRHFRVLEKIGENMVELNETYISNARANGAQDISELKQQVLDLVNEEINRINQSRRTDFVRQLNALAEAVESSSLRKSRQSIPHQSPSPADNIPTKSIKPFPPNATVSILNNRSFQVSAPGHQAYTLSFAKFAEKYSQRTNLDYEIILPNDNEVTETHGSNEISLRERQSDRSWEVRYSIPIKDQNDQRAFQIQLSRTMDDFIRPILREDVFEDFVILKREINDGKEELDVVYESFDNYFVPQLITKNLDSIRSQQVKYRQGAQLEDLPYLVHLQAVQFNQYQLILCGLVNKDKFSKERRKISTLLVLVLLLLILLLILGIPILKLGLISDKERMKISDLIFATTSAVFGSSLIILLLFDLYTYNGPGQEQRKQQLVDLSKAISSSLFAELNDIYEQLEYYDTLQAGSIQEGNQLQVLASPADSNPFFPSYYPYFTSVYWANLSDSIGRELTVRPKATPQVSLAGREYLEGIKEGRSWPLGKGSKRFRLESLLTRTNGEKLAVVSKSSTTNLGKAEQGKPASAVFLTSFLYSAIQPILPNGFGFAILDEEGRVLFHSDPRRNLQHNFLEETDNPRLRAALYNRSALYTNGNYLGEDHSFYVQPLDQLPLYLVSFRKKIYDRSTHEQIISLSFLLIFISLAIGLGFVGLLALFNPSSQILKQDRYTFDWLRPIRMNRRRYQLIAGVNVINLILAIWFTRNANAPVALSVIALSFVYSFLTAFFLLNRNQRNEFLWQSHRSVAFSTFGILVLFNLLLDAVLANTDSLQVRLFQFIPGLVLLLIIGRIFYRYMSRKDRRRLIWGPVHTRTLPESPDFSDLLLFQWNRVDRLIKYIPARIERSIMTFFNWLGEGGFRMETQRSYRLFLLSWLSVVAIFPVIKFYEVAYNREVKLQIQHSQIQFARDFKARNQAIDQRYLDIQIPDSLKNQLKSRGIFTGSYFQTQFTADLLEGTQVDIQYPVWRDTLFLSPGVIADTAKSYLLEIIFDTYDTCMIANVVPVGRRTFQRSGLATLYVNQPSYQVRYSVWQLAPNQIAFEVKMERSETLRSNATEQLEKLYTLHQDSIRTTFVINEQNAKEIILGEPRIITRRLLTPENMEAQPEAYVYLDSLFSVVRPSYNELVRRSTYLNRNASADSIWTWYLQPELTEVRSLNADLGIRTNQISKLIFQQKNGLQLTSILPPYRFPRVWDAPTFLGTRFWIGFIVSLVIFYLLIDFVVYRFFAQNTLFLHPPDAVSARKHLQETQENVFLVVPPRPLETDYLVILDYKIEAIEALKEAPTSYKREQYYFDLARKEERQRIDSLLQGHLSGSKALPPIVILDNFEAEADNGPICLQKLNLLDHLLQCAVQTVILSVQEPLELSLQFTLAANGAEASPNGDLRPTQKQWGRLLSNYSQLYFPLEKWKVLSNQREAQAFVSRKHSFLYLAEVSYRSSDLNIAGVSIQAEEGRATMEKGAEYGENPVIRIDQHIGTPYKLNQKLKKLLKWIDSNSYEQISILSCLNPSQILQVYNRDTQRYRKEIQAWKKLFDKFYKAILSDSPRNLRMKDRIREIIRRECAHGKFLQGIQNELVSQLETPGSQIRNTLVEEEIILQIGIRANLYYQALWSACSIDEQLLIYDLAQDGLINSRNLKAIEALLRKGIFVTDDDTIHLMNRSFRNFVLTVVRPEEALKMEETIKADAIWGRAKIPLAIIVFAVAAFLYYTDVSEVIDETAAFITAVTALIPVFTKMVATAAGVNLSFQKLLPNLRRGSREGE